MAMKVTQKTAIITGAGSGINLSFASLLLQNDCNVIIADLSVRPEAQELLSKYPLSSAGAKAYFQKTDVTEWRQLEIMFDVAVEKFGAVDIVVPGAGVFEPPWSNFWQPPGTALSKDNSQDSRYKLLDINLTHPIRLTQLSISHFLTHKRPGCILHLSSLAGQVPFFPTPIYVATKHAISGFVRSLSRLEHPPPNTGLPKIRVVAVAPALIKTPLWTENEDKMRFIGKGDEKGWITPEKVAGVMLDLVEKEEYEGGTVLEVGEGVVRRVEALNDPGPEAGGNAIKSSESKEDDMWKSLVEQMGKSGKAE